MRVNGHNDQCTCVECASPNQVQIAAFVGPSAGIQLNEVVPEVVGAKLPHPVPWEVIGGQVVGAIELDHVVPTGRIVALEIKIDERFSAMPPRWAVWWDRTINALVARPLRGQTT